MIKNEINTKGLTKGKAFAYETLNNLQLTTKMVEKLNQIKFMNLKERQPMFPVREGKEMWKIEHFQELSTIELYKIMYLRTATLIVEQQRIYQKIDKQDLQAIHVFKEDDDDTVTFGWVVTSKKVRGQGVGRQRVAQSADGDDCPSISWQADRDRGASSRLL